MRVVRMAAVGVAAGVAASIGAVGAAAADPPPFTLPTAQANSELTPASGATSRPLLIVYARYSDVHTGDADTEAAIHDRFFDPAQPSFAAWSTSRRRGGSRSRRRSNPPAPPTTAS